MKKITKIITAGCLSVSLVLAGTLPTCAAEKETNNEIVYVLSGADGQVKDAIVSSKEGSGTYTQTHTDKELPVSVSVTYKLDGKKISPEELAGKSGKVSIRFDYDNHQYEMKTIDGTKQKIYVPFTMLTGVVLDEDVFSNVSVTGGKLIDDGSRMAVVGMAFPGLKDNLNLKSDSPKIPDHLEITADVNHFKLGTTYTVATNELFSNADSSKLDTATDLADQLATLSQSLTDLTEGMNQLNDGSAALVDGCNQIAGGVEELSNGLNTLSSKNAALNGGARQVFQSLLDTANAQIKSSGANLPTLTIENYSTVLTGALQMAGAGTAEAGSGAQSLLLLKAQLDNYNAFYQGLQSYTAGVSSAAKGASQLKASMPQFISGVKQLNAGTQQLVDGINSTDLGGLNLSEVTDRLDVTKEVSRNYKSFSENSKNSDSVKFVYRTEEIK